MIVISEFEPEFASAFPELNGIFSRAGLTVHEGVARVTLHGLRGTPGELQSHTELDLRLLVDSGQYPEVRQDEELLKDILYATLAPWREKYKLDLTVVFDTRNCQLKCFSERSYSPTACSVGGFDCFGMYKIEDGVPGFIANSGMNIRYIYPCVTVWRNPRCVY